MFIFAINYAQLTHSLTLFAGGNEPIKVTPLEDFEGIAPIKKNQKSRLKEARMGKETRGKHHLRNQRRMILKNRQMDSLKLHLHP